MNEAPRKIGLEEWDVRHASLIGQGLREPIYGGVLGRHVGESRDYRLRQLLFDNSPAALRLWNFLLTEEERLRRHREEGKKLVGAMKDLGTVPVMAFALPELVAFYPDGAWWTPCLMEHSDGLLAIADRLGIDDSFCPVRAMLGAFVTGEHFPIPELLVCSAGAVCDDFSAIAQCLEPLGFPVFWWEIPRRRAPEPGEKCAQLPGGFFAPEGQVDMVRGELERVRGALQELAGHPLDDPALARGIRAANAVRRLLRELRDLVFTASAAPLPALELLVAEMLALHYCSDREESAALLEGLLAEVKGRVAAKAGVLPADAARVFWVNPVADLRAMNLLEECGGRLCGTDFMFAHALAHIPEQEPPMVALAKTAMADPMIGPTRDRAGWICGEMKRLGAEALVVSRIPGASHCAREGDIIRGVVEEELSLPTLEIEVPPVSDALEPALRSRLRALVETVISRRDS